MQSTDFLRRNASVKPFSESPTTPSTTPQTRFTPALPRASTRYSDAVLLINASFLSQEHLPARGSPRNGGTAETRSAKRGTVRFAVTGGASFRQLRAMVLKDLQIANRVGK